jgi:hypothetical protein
VATFIRVVDYLFHHINLTVQFEPPASLHVLPSCDHGGGLRSLGEGGGGGGERNCFLGTLSTRRKVPELHLDSSHLSHNTELRKKKRKVKKRREKKRTHPFGNTELAAGYSTTATPQTDSAAATT